MASEQVIKKVKLLGTWNEDVITHEIVQTISALAGTEKGKSIKIVLNQKGVKLIRSKLFQESKTTIYSLQELRAVTRSPDFSRCVLLILSNVDKKYKIIALRCASEKDAAHLISGFAEIQSHLQSSYVELKKKDSGNWTLRERLKRTSFRRVRDIFRDHKQNGVIVAEKENGNATLLQRPNTDINNIYTSSSYQKGTYTKRSNGGPPSSHKAHRTRDHEMVGDIETDYVIETEVMTTPYPAREARTRQYSNDMHKGWRQADHATLKVPTVENGWGETDRHVVQYGQSITPKPGVVYEATSRSILPSQPVIYRQPSSKVYEARIEPPLAYSTKSARVSDRGSMQSEVLPVRVWGGNWNLTFDQRSVRSNTSKASRSRRKRSSDFYYSTTLTRAIEDTYPRPSYIIHRVTDPVIAYRPSSGSHVGREHVTPQIYVDDGPEGGKHHYRIV